LITAWDVVEKTGDTEWLGDMSGSWKFSAIILQHGT
jgi:hypothetical protein